MKKFPQPWLAWLALLLCAFAPLAPGVHAQPAPAAATPAAMVQAAPQTNAEIRQWYNDEVARIPQLNQEWLQNGYSAEKRAELAQEMRHNARLKAREFMGDKREVAELQKRDQEKYGNPDGPSLAYLVAQNRKRGLTGDAVYEEIVGSAVRTNEEYNAKNGVKPAARTP